MVTRTVSLATTSLAVGIVAALLGQTAVAMEEVVAYRNDSPVRAVDHASRFQAEMENYAQSLNRDLKDTLAKQLEQLSYPKLKLAISEVPQRG
jgi:hypothetical protein